MIRINEDKLLYQGKWLRLKVSDITNTKNDKNGTWEYSQRVSSNPPVVCIAKTNNNELILIKQFRVPIKRWQFEFPAGIGEDNESLETVALREFEEETGFKGRVLSLSSELSASAGLTDETYYIAKLEVVGTGNIHFDDHEDIELFLLKSDSLSISNFLENAKKNNDVIDAKVYSYLIGLVDGK